MSIVNWLQHELPHWCEHLAHVLPAQAPIRDFVHHNTLHGFQHLPFPEALSTVEALTGGRGYWPLSRFLSEMKTGRIDETDLFAVCQREPQVVTEFPLPEGITQPHLWRAALLMAAKPVSQPDPLLFSIAEALTVTFKATHQAPLAEVTTLDWQTLARQRWLKRANAVSGEVTQREVLCWLGADDLMQPVLTVLQRQLAAHLDLGLAVWHNPVQSQGLFAAWRASALNDLAWELSDLPQVHREIAELPEDPWAVLARELPLLSPDRETWYAVIERLCLAMPGWSGMCLQLAMQPARGNGQPLEMVDYLAILAFLERLLSQIAIRRLIRVGETWADLSAYFSEHVAEYVVRELRHAPALPEALANEAARLLHPSERRPPQDVAWAQLAAEMLAWQQAQADSAAHLNRKARQLALLWEEMGIGPEAAALWAPEAAWATGQVLDALPEERQGWLWLNAYERHYREKLLHVLAANIARREKSSLPTSAQVIICMDDREEGTRRHLEALAPDIQTFGAAGFYGVPMRWQGLGAAQGQNLCPVVVQPQHLIRELPKDPEATLARQQRRARWAAGRERLMQSTRSAPFAAPLFTLLGGGAALAGLVARTLSPSRWGAWLSQAQARWLGAVPTRLTLTAEAPLPERSAGHLQIGFTDQEQVDRVEAFLRMIGLIDHFAPLVLMLGHGSDSQNNPHRSAYDCGACSGKHGGPNARVFASMANRPEVRAGLKARGIEIPDTCWFVSAQHNTCDDQVDWYDLETIPVVFQSALDRLMGQLSAACRAHAVERCRRLASAPLGMSPWQASLHVQGRLHDPSQARPELGHATNAAAVIGRRELTRGTFLDRRVFLISYDPTQDVSGHIVENILLAAGPVGAGISLEYYFSTVNNAHFGCGSKITHNLTGLFGVMEGAASDLRTGLPWQMVEIHEPMRLLVVVERDTDTLSAIVGRQPALQELIGHGWIVVVACDPDGGGMHEFVPNQGWVPWAPNLMSVPEASDSQAWFAGQREALPPALLTQEVSHDPS